MEPTNEQLDLDSQHSCSGQAWYVIRMPGGVGGGEPRGFPPSRLGGGGNPVAIGSEAGPRGLRDDPVLSDLTAHGRKPAHVDEGPKHDEEIQ
jgi:hypothetical protein